jgi:hypothetical protein
MLDRARDRELEAETARQSLADAPMDMLKQGAEDAARAVAGSLGDVIGQWAMYTDAVNGANEAQARGAAEVASNVAAARPPNPSATRDKAARRLHRWTGKGFIRGG